jgi:hypothetical protein
MNCVRVSSYRFCILILFVLSHVGWVFSTQAGPTSEELIQKAVERSRSADTSAVPDINYTKVTITEELDASGKITDRKQKTYKVALRSGLSQVTLVQVNGRAPAESDRRQQTENETSLRKLLGQPKGAKGSTQENFLTPEIVARFDFSLMGETNINGRATYQLSFEPKSPEPPVHRMVDRLLNRISGTLWIDAQESEVARVEVFLRSEVNLLGGVIGCLKKLAYTMVRNRTDDGLWFNALSSGDFEGRKLLDSTHIKTKSETTHFERAS